MTLKELFKNNKTVLTDGAMGTYYSQLTGNEAELCEKANVTSPEIIEKIHSEYIAAGAKLIRTNTFSANSVTLSVTHEQLGEIIRSGYQAAEKCAREKAVVCADVSAIYDNTDNGFDVSGEYQFIIDTFLEAGAQNFIFETLSELEAVLPAVDYILEKKADAEIIVSFTLLPDGFTRSGLSVERLLDSIIANKDKFVAVGLNCGSGAVQMYAKAVPFFTYIREHTDLFTIVMPNAGYPSIVNRRTVYNSAPSYFARQTARFIPHGLSAVGGCCGTTPEYIRLLAKYINNGSIDSVKEISYNFSDRKPKSVSSSRITEDRFVIAAELDPPYSSDFSKMIAAAKILKDCGVDMITVSDSPLGHAKADSVVCSARIKREVGIDTLPHICCRDKNINALRSILLGAHSEGIRSVLAVTGDHIAETDRGVIKPVFNLDSTKLMTLIGELNGSVFADSPIAVGGAFDPAAPRAEFALKRLDKKIACGAKFVLTQPVFTEKAIECIKEANKKDVKVIAGIMPMVSFRNASFMQNEVPGMVIPDELVSRFSPEMSREEAEEVGMGIAAELAERIRPYVDGFYFITPFNRANVIKGVIERLKNRKVI